MNPTLTVGDDRAPTALVTGGARGIGKAIVAALRADGVRVAAADLIDVGQWGDGHPANLKIHLDVTSDESCRATVAQVQKEFGGLDYLVNSAGVVHRAAASDMPAADFLRVLDVNLIGTFRMCQASLPLLAERRGAVVNISSVNGVVAAPDKVAYCSSKAAVNHMTRTLALEWASLGVRVNAVAPTLVETEINADMRSDPEWLSAALATIPLGRAATVAEIASAVTYFLSEGAALTTGQVLGVDGGATLQ